MILGDRWAQFAIKIMIAKTRVIPIPCDTYSTPAKTRVIPIPPIPQKLVWDLFPCDTYSRMLSFHSVFCQARRNIDEAKKTAAPKCSGFQLKRSSTQFW